MVAINEDVYCPECKKVMENLGNVTGMIYTSYPEMWNELYVCHTCKTKTNVTRRGKREPDRTYLESYKDV